MGLRTPCVLIDWYRAGLQRQVILPDKNGPRFRRGVLGVVEAGGRGAAGDPARVTLPEGSGKALAACSEIRASA
jgi:hypothetical protein